MSRTHRLRPLAGLLAAGLAAPQLAAPARAAPSQPFPTYTAGPQANGTWIVSTGQVISPAGLQVGLGIRVRAKQVAVNPTPGAHSAAVLTQSGTQAVEVFDTLTGNILQEYLPFQDPYGSYAGIAYSADGKHLLLSQAFPSNITLANVDQNGLLSDAAFVATPPYTGDIECFPGSPFGPYSEPCGTLYTPSTAYPGSLAFSADGSSAYALLNQNDTLAFFDLTQNPIVQGNQIRVGNAPHSIVVSGTTAYVSNEGGRAATDQDFTVLSAGTPIVASYDNGSPITGTVSVVDLATQAVTATINVGLQPTGLAFAGKFLLVANTASDSISVINTLNNKVARTIDLGLPISVPGQPAAYGAGPVSIAVSPDSKLAYVALYNANAIAVVNLNAKSNPVMGLIPTAFAPASVVLDSTNNTNGPKF